MTADTGTQLAAAIAFLHAHRGRVPLITLDIGANDLNPCLALGSISAITDCLPPVFAADLPVDLGVRAAARGPERARQRGAGYGVIAAAFLAMLRDIGHQS